MIIMKRINKLYKKLVFAIVFISGIFFTSCTDYLTIIPPSVVVHEDFWKNEAEVNGMAATAYLTLSNSNALRNAIFWGETRAETVDYPAGSANDNQKYITEGLLYDDNGYASWTEYYSAINYCNLVLEYGPLVMEQDPNFSEGDMQVLEGQMKALRAYAHFVLLRAFCNIPLATKAVINDAEIPEYRQAHPMEALKVIYADLEDASTKVLLSGINTAQNLGYVTTNAVYALMADVNMWQAAFAKYYVEIDGTYTPEHTADEYYDMAVENCQKVLDSMDKIHKEFYFNKNEKSYAYNLLQNTGEVEDREKGYSSVYETIFGGKNSRESIFEFQIDDSNYSKGGNGIAAAYGAGGNNGGMYVVQENWLSEIYEDDDLRQYAFTTKYVPNPDGSSSDTGTNAPVETFVAKYTAKSTATSYGASATRTYRANDSYDANWIVYRKTDIMLMKAEALLSRSVASEDEIKEAFNMTEAINKRWRMDTTDIDNELKYNDYVEQRKCLELVRDERVRELCFEGRRWFDIVRMALQGEDTSFSYKKKRHGVDDEEMLRRYNHISAYFMPIAKNEIRFNPLLEQNKSCKSSDNSEIEQN